MKHKRRNVLRCRLHLHVWSCHDSRACRGDHHCTQCQAVPNA